MAVKSSGAISIQADLVAEFGGTAPHSLSEYYGGAGLVPAGANPSVPGSGAIGMSNMYGSVAATVLTYTTNTNNVNIATDVVAAGGDLNTPVILTIGSGVTIGSTDSTTPAMTTGTGWGSGVTINITNNGSIVGATGSTHSGYARGGTAGQAAGYGNTAQSGFSGYTATAADSSANGGDAFYHAQEDTNLSVIFDTTGTRTAGSGASSYFVGGGGGGGGGGYGTMINPFRYANGHNGGGGAGDPGGSKAPYMYSQTGCTSAQGNAGTLTAGGAGGSGYCAASGVGGDGGGNGSSGGSGGSGYRYTNPPGSTNSGGSGGAAGSNATFSGSAGNVIGGNTSQVS